MTIKKYIKNYNVRRKPKNVQQKVAEYLVARRDDIVTDFNKDDDYSVKDYLATKLTKKIIYRLEKLCVKYYDTMLSSDVDYFLAGYNMQELKSLVETN